MKKLEMFFGENVVCPFLDKETYEILVSGNFTLSVLLVLTPPASSDENIVGQVTRLLFAKLPTCASLLRHFTKNSSYLNWLVAKSLYSTKLVEGEYTVSIVYNIVDCSDKYNYKTSIIFETSYILSSDDYKEFLDRKCELEILGVVNPMDALRESLDVNGARHSS